MNEIDSDYTATRLADEAGVTSSYVQRLCRQGIIPGMKYGGATGGGGVWIIKREDAEAWLQSREEADDAENES